MMTATELLFNLLEKDPSKLSKTELLILEAELFLHLYAELKKYFQSHYQNYFRLMKFNTEMEEDMLEANFIRLVINDILSTEEYSLIGIAAYVHVPEEVLFDLVSGQNTSPSLMLSRKIIALHRTVRPNLYGEIMRKVIERSL